MRKNVWFLLWVSDLIKRSVFSVFRTTGGASSSTNNASASAKQSSSSTSRQLARSRARIMRTTSVRNNGSGSQGGSGSSSRGTGVIIGSGSSGRSLVTVPAPFVPEELVSQAQVVLQGKSRNVIIRELQVNQSTLLLLIPSMFLVSTFWI